MNPRDRSADVPGPDADTDAVDSAAIDTEHLGRLLLDRQGPAERDESRRIFQRMLHGESPDRLQDEIQHLARLRVRRIQQQRRDTHRR